MESIGTLAAIARGPDDGVRSIPSQFDTKTRRNQHESIPVKPCVVENRLRHRGLFEIEYEYRCTEYEYDLSDVHDGESPIRFVTTAETLSEALPAAKPFLRPRRNAYRRCPPFV